MQPDPSKIVSLNRQRLRKEARERRKETESTRTGVFPLSEEEFVAFYRQMLEWGKFCALTFDPEKVKVVLDDWTEAIQAGMRGELAATDDQLAIWDEHRAFADAFLQLVYRCHGYQGGDELPSVDQSGASGP